MEPTTKANANGAGGFDQEARELLSTDQAFNAARAMREEIETEAARDTSMGRPPKKVVEARQAKEMIQVLTPLLEGINELVGNRWEPLRYSDKELEIVATLGGRVLSKYVDVGLEKYGEEIMLATYLGSTAAQKGTALWRQLKAEEAERERAELKAERNGDRPHDA